MSTPTITPSGWYPDPSGRHQYRYWDGKGWSSQVSDGGRTATDSALRSATSRADAPTPHPLATPAAAITPPGWPQPATQHSETATPSPQRPLPSPQQPPVFQGPTQEQVAMSKPPPAPVAARAGRNRWLVPVIAVLVVIAVIAGLLIWAPWVSKVPMTPAALRAQSPTATSVVVRWALPTTGPVVDHYLIRRDGVQVGSVTGKVTSYQDNGLNPATAYRYSVVAVSGTVRSLPSSALVAKTLTPPISEARLQGSWTVDMKYLTGGAGGHPVGDTETDTWALAPRCTSGPCDVWVSGELSGTTFTMNLTRAGAVYTGTTTAQIFTCGTTAPMAPMQNTLTVQVTVGSARGNHQAWAATSWAGTMKIDSPYTEPDATHYCPASTDTATLTGH